MFNVYASNDHPVRAPFTTDSDDFIVRVANEPETQEEAEAFAVSGGYKNWAVQAGGTGAIVTAGGQPRTK